MTTRSLVWVTEWHLWLKSGTKEDRPLEGVCLVSDMLTMRLLCSISNEQKKYRIDLKFLDLVFNYIQMKSTKSGLFPLFLRVLHLYLFQCDLQLVLHLLHFCFLI